MEINLTPEQSKKLVRDGYCYYIEPINIDKVIQLYEVENKNGIYRESKFKYELKYQPGQKVKASFKVDCSDSIIKSHRPKELIVDWGMYCIIDEIQEPKRVQEIDKLFFGNLMPKDKYVISSFFNKHFAEPKPVKCDICEEGKVEGAYFLIDKDCDNCYGTGIEKYISYVYDENYIDDMLNQFSYIAILEDKDYYYEHKGRPLEIIVNPYCEIIKLIKGN